MDQSSTTREWLGWLTRVRLLTILLILVLGLLWPQYVLPAGVNRSFLPLFLIWFSVGALHLALVRWLPGAPWPGELLHLPLLAGHHRHQHFVFAPRGFCHDRTLSGNPRRDGCPCLCGKNPP